MEVTMKKPEDGETLTQAQVGEAVNVKDFEAVEIKKNWHIGQFEPWALDFGYPDGMPIYGGVEVDGVSAHIYFLNDGHQASIILRRGETPATYHVTPTS
jgi:hypothetical protein